MSAERLRREYGCTLAEWQRWLPGATTGCVRVAHGERAAEVWLEGGGRLQLCWEELPPRVIALVRLPRLQVDFAFDHTTEAQRARFLRVFDMHLQRGGG